VHAASRLLELRQAGNVEVVMLRPGIVYGPRSAWTAGFADELLAGQAYLVGGGSGVCNGIYIDNLVHAIRLAANASNVDGRAYLVSDAAEFTWRDLCRPIAEALGYKVEHLPDPPVAGENSNLMRRLRRMPSVVQTYRKLPDPIRHGLRAAYDSYRSKRSRTGEVIASHTLLKASYERALLHCCGYRLPMDRARFELNFEPIVSFEEGCRRSVAWLEFAGYPVAN
jgi:2-alkyl-3-oxoalkanoate reductase